MEEKKYKWKTRGALYITIPILIVLLMFPMYGFYAINRDIMGVRLAALNNIVEAKLTGVEPRSSGTVETTIYHFNYTYIAPNGQVYKGETFNCFSRGREDAMKRIENEEKIEIYIDDIGNSIPVMDVKSPWVTITTTTISLVVILIYSFIFLVPRKVSLEKIEKKYETETKQEE